MPRLPTSLLLLARSQHPLLVPLLRTCRDLTSARNEFRWLKEHAYKPSPERVRSTTDRVRKQDGGIKTPHGRVRTHNGRVNTTSGRRKTHGGGQQISTAEARLKRMCHERGRGKPLQYILGTEYFGELEIECREGVLIPRQETADLVLMLGRRLRNGLARTNKASGEDQNENKNNVDVPLPKPLRILDLCTGTGCMSLLLHHELRKPSAPNSKKPNPQPPPTLRPTPEILGIDISPKAVSLARANRTRLLPYDERSDIRFERADIFDAASGDGSGSRTRGLTDLLKTEGKMEWDILIANPPYISPKAFYRDTARSVRNFEPRCALVPPPPSSLPLPPPPSPSPSPATDEKSKILHDQTQGDSFYPRLLSLAKLLDARVILFEVADLAQGLRVAGMAMGETAARQQATTKAGEQPLWDGGVEVWRDGIGDECAAMEAEEVEVDGGRVVVRGPKGLQTNGRGVVCWRDVGGQGGALFR